MGETCENDWKMMETWRFLGGNVIYKLEMFHDFPSGPFQESSKQHKKCHFESFLKQLVD